MPAPAFRPSRTAAVVVLAAALVATACGGGVRPTLTGERIDESASSLPSEVATLPAATTAETAPRAADQVPPTPTETALAPGEIEQLSVQVLETLPHDPNAWTQGLEIDNGMFIESTGLVGESDLRRVDIATGEITQIVTTPNNFFAEGVTKVGDELIQLTWTDETALYWDAATFELKKEVRYTGEGWGLCYDGNRLVMTDGTSSLIFRDPTTFDETGRVTVTFNGQEVNNLNEVECVNGVVWANIWQSSLIVRIDPSTGLATGLVDAVSLRTPDPDGREVLNGIAWDESTQSFYVTGKLWPEMFRVNFVPSPAG